MEDHIAQQLQSETIPIMEVENWLKEHIKPY